MMVQLIAALGVILVILQMPLRDPGNQRDAIGSQFEPPSSKLRSPEDNMTLWQFMVRGSNTSSSKLL